MTEETAPAETSADDAAPTWRVVSGRPTDEDLAALVVVVAAASGSASEPGPAERRRPSAWADPARRLVGPGVRSDGWRASGLPR